MKIIAVIITELNDKLVKLNNHKRSRISPFLKISPTGLVLRNEERRELLDSIQQKIRR